MKKIFLILVLSLAVSVANAWDKRPEEGVFVLSTKHLSEEAKTMVTKYLGTTYADDIHYLYTLEKQKKAKHSKDIHYLHLDSQLKPAKVEGDDALKGIEKALAVIRARDSHSKIEVTAALRTVINLMCDIHNFSNIRIEGIPHSQQDFKFTCYAGDIGKRKTTSQVKWSRFWTIYGYWHTGFSGNLWAEDLELSLGDKRAEFAQGTMQDWIAQIGAKSASLYSYINPEYTMTRRERNELEVLNCEMMARAGYRLAVLLNEVAK